VYIDNNLKKKKKKEKKKGQVLVWELNMFFLLVQLMIQIKVIPPFVYKSILSSSMYKIIIKKFRI